VGISTWGNLRLQLQTGAPGIPLDLLDGWLNSRYEQVLEANDWQGLKYHTTVQSQAAYQSGTDTVTLTVGSATVTGAGTAWTSGQLGNIPRFYRPGDTVIYTASYVGPTQLTLDRPYEGNGIDAAGTVYSGSAYVLMQHIYALPSDVRTIVSCLDPVTNQPLHIFTKDQLDASAGPRTLVEDPVYAALYDDTNESSQPVYHQIEFFPPPLHARGFPLEYVHGGTFFNGSNTSASPLPWVSDSVLLYGARAEIALHLEQFNKAKGYEMKFAEELARLLRLEHWQKRPKRALGMTARFTRHRTQRATRALSRNWGPGQGGPN